MTEEMKKMNENLITITELEYIQLQEKYKMCRDAMCKYSDLYDESRSCYCCYYAFEGKNYERERCRKCSHKSNFRRIHIEDFKEK